MSPGGGTVDTIGLGPIARKGVEVRLLSWTLHFPFLTKGCKI